MFPLLGAAESLRCKRIGLRRGSTTPHRRSSNRAAMQTRTGHCHQACTRSSESVTWSTGGRSLMPDPAGSVDNSRGGFVCG